MEKTTAKAGEERKRLGVRQGGREKERALGNKRVGFKARLLARGQELMTQHP